MSAQPTGDLPALRDATVLVTGGCGFIGSHLVRRLLAEGSRVVVLDSLRYGDAANLGADADRIRLVRATLGHAPRAVLEDACRGADLLVHLAAEKHNQSRDDPDAVLTANVLGTRLLFECAAAAGVRKTVFASSLYAYGRLTGPPMDEAEVPLPATIYGISKLCGERLLAHYASPDGMHGDVLRYFFVYGPRQFAGMGYKSVILRNFERLARGEAPRIFGDGRQALDYVYVDDVVAATLRALCAPTSGALLNVASGVAVRVAELTAAMCTAAGSALAPVHEPPDWTAGSCRAGTNARIRAALDWTPRVPLAEGLARTWAWMREAPAA
ncbi:MAG: NAD-dependent epimerase/dehydratase family protein [bacterium]|nr:NAD-dependent epimerase/dehydratase family protein [bacterium]